MSRILTMLLRPRWAIPVGVVMLAVLLDPVVSLSRPAAAPRPVVGRFVVAGRLDGRVFVTAPGGSRAPLAGPRRLTVGTAVDATKGSVQIIAADGTGATRTGRFAKGQFRIFQPATHGAIVEIVLIGARACPEHGPMADEVAAGATRAPRRHPRAIRQLDITASASFVVVGRNLRATASGQAVYSLTDECDGTHVLDKSGNVQARGQRGLTDLRPNLSLVEYCSPKAPNTKYCLEMVSSSKQSIATFAVLLAQGSATSYRVCYTTPGRRVICHTGPLDPRVQPEAGDLVCFVNDGVGRYAARWLLNGRQLGVTLHFDIDQVVRPELGTDSCQASIETISP
jgi:hypothetical protein